MRRKELGLLKGYAASSLLLCIISTVSGQGCYNNALLQYKVYSINGYYSYPFSSENSTASDCQRACRNSCKCAQFIWWGDVGVADSVALCNLYDRTKLSAGSGDGAWLIGNRSLEAEACDGLLSTYTEHPKMMVSAVDMETLRENVTPESCSAACNAHCDCAGFTVYTDSEGKTACGLKNDVSDQTPEESTSLWIRDGKCKDWSNVYTHYSGKDAPGNDFAFRILSNVDDCRAFCNSNCECFAFSFFLARNGIRYCTLKNLTSIPTELRTNDFYLRQPGIQPQTPDPSPNVAPAPIVAPDPSPNVAPAPILAPAPSKTPDPSPNVAPAPIVAPAPSNESMSSETSKSTALVVGGSVGGGALLAFLVAAAFCFYIKKRRHRPMRPPSAIFDGLKVYTYEELRNATTDFGDVLGGGGSAEVFRAELEGRMVAVKRLKESEDRKTSDQEFTAEARGLGVLLHVNLVRLLGYSNDPDRPKMLVYEFIHGGTLESLLYGGKDGVPPPVPLSFDQRMAIALGIAQGVEYCHHSIETPLIHRDIKPANILMTTRGERAVPKVADFGLARLLDTSDQGTAVVLDMTRQPQPAAQVLQLPDGGSNSAASVFMIHGSSSTSASSSSGPVGRGRDSSTAHTQGAQFTSVAGTMGYIDPEYLQTSRPTRKSDVYSFGVVLLELIMGLRPVAIYERLLAAVSSGALNSQTGVSETEAMCTYESMSRQLLQQGEAAVRSLVASTLGQDELDSHRTFQAMRIALECLQGKGKMRPSMHKVVRMLEQMTEGETKS